MGTDDQCDESHMGTEGGDASEICARSGQLGGMRYVLLQCEMEMSLHGFVGLPAAVLEVGKRVRGTVRHSHVDDIFP